MSAHAIHNASASGIWLECDEYYHHKVEALEAGEDFDQAGPAALRGSKLHDIAEAVLPFYYANPESILSELIAQADDAIEDGPSLTDEDLLQCEIAIEGACDLLDAFEVEEFGVELHVPLSHEPESTGAIDLLGYNSEGRVLIVDYKFGQQAVAAHSSQLQIYAANALDRVREKYSGPIVDVGLAIIQPALHAEPVVFRTTEREILRFQHHVEHVVERQRGGSRRGADYLGPCGSWCPFTNRCGTYARLVGEIADLADGEEGLNDWQIERVVRSKAAINTLLADCTKRIVEDEEAFPDWTRTHVKNPAKWLGLEDEEIVQNLLNIGVTDVYQLATPAKVRDRHPKLADEIAKFVTDEGTHIRLRYAAKKEDVPIEEPNKRARA